MPGAKHGGNEIRKDKVLPGGQAVWRVYLDNYDLLEKYPRETLLDPSWDRWRRKWRPCVKSTSPGGSQGARARV